MQTSPDFEEFLGYLNDYKVRYVIVGGYAFAIHAEPRFTIDIDIFIDATAENSKRLLYALEAFGFGDAGLTTEDFQKANQIIQLGYPPLRIDILTSIEGVDFEQAWRNRIKSDYGSKVVWFIGKRELIQNKKATGREQDLLDLKKLDR